MDISSKLKAIISDNCDIEISNIDSESTWESLGLDSLDAIEIIMALENDFQIDIDDYTAMQLPGKTFSELVEYIKSRTVFQVPDNPEDPL